MLTRSRKKRTTGKDKSYDLKNSNKKDSTALRNDAVKVGEMLTMDHDGTSGGMDDDCQRTDYLQVAWLLREKLNDLVDGDKREFLGLGLRSLLDMAVSRNIVSADPEMLNPVLWRTLPKELLLLVLARLPLPDITRLSCLSREWRRDMATANSEINQACHEASPTMVALLSYSHARSHVGPPAAFFVTIYDFTNCKWQSAYHLSLPSRGNDDSEMRHLAWTAVNACDGGLVCFISVWIPTKRNPLCIVVVNLMTRVQHQLPPLHYLYFALPAMVQIKVDNFDTTCYKVVVVGYRRGGRLSIEIYDSGTRQWTRTAPPCGSIFGRVHNWFTGGVEGWYDSLSSTTPGAYDFAEGKLELNKKNNPSTGKSVVVSVLVKNRMFVLQAQERKDTSRHTTVYHDFCVTEYHVENEAKGWMRWRSFECPFLKELMEGELYDIRLEACDGFLMISMRHYGKSPYFWVLDLSTSEWSNFPGPSSQEMHISRSLMCRCRVLWNVNP